MTVASLFSDPGWQQLGRPFSPTMISGGKNDVDALREYKRGTSQDKGRCFCGLSVAASFLMGCQDILMPWCGQKGAHWRALDGCQLRPSYWLAVSPQG